MIGMEIRIPYTNLSVIREDERDFIRKAYNRNEKRKKQLLLLVREIETEQAYYRSKMEELE